MASRIAFPNRRMQIVTSVRRYWQCTRSRWSSGSAQMVLMIIELIISSGLGRGFFVGSPAKSTVKRSRRRP